MNKNLNTTSLLTTFGILISLFLLWNLKDILIQLFASIIIAMALCTVIGKLKQILSIPRTVAFFITLISFLLIGSISILIIIPQFIGEFQELINQIPSAFKTLWELFNNSIDSLTDIIYKDRFPLIEKSSEINNQISIFPDGTNLANGITDSLSKLIGLAGNLSIGFLQLLFISTVALMITIQPNSYKEVAILLVPSFYRKRFRSILSKCGNGLTSWMNGVILSSICVTSLTCIGLYLLGIKLVFANALIAGLLNIIPNVGPTISTIFPMSVALLDAPWKSIAVLGLYILIQNIESYLITPFIMHKHVKLLPGLTITAQFLFTIIFGPLGLLLAIPMAVVIQVFIKEILIHDILESKNIIN